MGMHEQFATGFGFFENIAAPFALLVQRFYGRIKPGKIVVKKVFRALSENFSLAPAMQPFGALAPIPNNTADFCHDDCVLREIKQSGLFAQLLLLREVLLLFLGFTQSAP